MGTIGKGFDREEIVVDGIIVHGTAPLVIFLVV